MNKHKFSITVFMACALLMIQPAQAQLTTTSTTLTAAIAINSTNQWCLGSATGVTLPSLAGGTIGSYLMADREAVQVTSQGATALCFNVKRGQLGTSTSFSHLATTKVYVGGAATANGGDLSRPFSGAFVATVPVGSCVASAQYTLPVIFTGAVINGFTGKRFNCIGGRWGYDSDSTFFVPPSHCSFAPTTLTTTNTLTTVGASNVYVLNGVSNAAAGTNTLTCNILIPSSITYPQGAVITDITTFFGSQVVAPTSLGTVTLGSITFPTAATVETASTVTPVTLAGGTVTSTTPTALTTVTTAGAFLSIKSAFGTPVPLSTDLQMLVFNVPFVQSAASAMTVNTPGLMVHYTERINN